MDAASSVDHGGTALAAALVAAYVGLVLGLRADFERHFGQQVEGYFANGAPRWRCALGLPTQVGTLPLLLGCAVVAHRFDVQRWGERTSHGELRSVGERAFVAVFPAFLLLDWQICDVRVLLAAHHVVCLAGHACAVLLSAGFPWYFLGVCALELGSASCNLFCLYPSSTMLFALYEVAMSASNLAALVCTWRWVAALDGINASVSRRRLCQAFGALLSLLLVAARQWEAIKAHRHHNGALAP
mmetsp:Transcript_43232/g.140210  ORF Transcript_43232/g.140210 Transcript_43232/m.140210 type:complete len:243 (-) Transcript_43232:127-855(-)